MDDKPELVVIESRWAGDLGLRIEVPGVNKLYAKAVVRQKIINVDVWELFICVNRWEWTWDIPVDINHESISIHMNDGLLEVSMWHKTPRKIRINIQ